MIKNRCYINGGEYEYDLSIFACFLCITICQRNKCTIRKSGNQGDDGGEKNSGDCGFIADKPNHILQLPQKVYSLSITVEAEGGKPSLLVIGPTDKERFCVLGDTTLGRKPEIKGVWLPGRYLIYVGEMEGNRYPFTLRINQ